LGHHADKLVLALNRVDNVGEIQASDVEETLHRRIPVKLVSDARLATYAFNRGIPFVTSNPESTLARGIVGLAKLVAQLQDEVSETPEAARTRSGHGPFSKLRMPLRRGARHGSEKATASR
jgi:MinD-like ATPase involved in chromosome partitioning or flagellar assembly